jgi:hypothetical protein
MVISKIAVPWNEIVPEDGETLEFKMRHEETQDWDRWR